MIQFRLLGGIDACIDGRSVDIGGARQRGVLAVLMVEVNRGVRIDQLVERIWAHHRLPNHPANAVQTYISLLRRALAPEPGVGISRRAGGYVLAADPGSIDLHRFGDLLDRAATADDSTAAGLLRSALALWCGEPFGGLDMPWLRAMRSALDRRRLAAECDLADIRLRCGEHTALVAELVDRAAAHPLDERVTGQLMLALYRSGRPAEALARFRTLRRRLADELGIDPTPPLCQLHQQILAADPVVTGPGPMPRARAARAVVPRQLPGPPPLFTGRTAALADVDRGTEATGGMAILVVEGIGGIGKTWLALHWAHRNSDRFPDGQLYLNLRGFDPVDSPMAPETAVRGLLDALGVAGHDVPAGLDAQIALYRSMVAGRTMLVVLDDAHDVAQVAALLPGSPSCTVLVTSRHHLVGLVATHGAHLLDLGTLTERESRELLVRHLGPARVDAEPAAVDELVAHCAGLPLAVGIVAARAASGPRFPLRALAGELRETSGRLDALDAGDPVVSVRAVLAGSYGALDGPAARAFGLLGLAPHSELDLAAAAALIGAPVPLARQVLRTLAHGHLVEQHEPGRYRLLDLVRLYAVEQAERDHPRGERDAALLRLVSYYLHTAHTADRLLQPHREPIDLTGQTRSELPDVTAALAWFDAELPGLHAAHQLAVRHGWHDVCWQLAWALDTYCQRRGLLPEHLAAWRIGLTGAQRGGLPPAAHIVARRRLGYAAARAGRHDYAAHHLRRALDLAETTGDTYGGAHTHHALAWAAEWRGNHALALDHAISALRRYRDADDPVWEATALNQVGRCHTALGNPEPAMAYAEQALAMFRAHRDRAGEAAALDTAGRVAHLAGDHDRAVAHYHQAFGLSRECGDTYACADILDRLGRAYRALGEHDLARDNWDRAMALYREQHRTADAQRLRRRCDDLVALPATDERTAQVF